MDKNEFIDAYNRHNPSNFLLFLFKARNALNPIAIYTALLAFSVGLVVMIVNIDYVKYTSLGYIPLLILFIVATLAHVINNTRIKRLCKELDISTSQYNFLVKAYL